ncbi:Reticulocyte-binding protein 2 -like protein a [Collichthys lucidus]|uniref:Reticulocyte-binding protein 2-like protein a n=1 Tax=Collichthys lucidus TaxID=240159 RepID=A0A4U5U524_COLLU|nr:Reticulocyte-binding protein 2 -like protein a [Collichthys lucidus]
MKPDGVTMETTEPTEAAAVAEPSSSQENILEQAPTQPEEAANDAAPTAKPKVNGKPAAADPKTKPKAGGTKTQPAAKSAGSSGVNSRPGTASHRTANDVKSSNNVSSVKKTTAAAKASATTVAGAVPKRPMGVATVSSTVKNQSRVPDKKPVGPARTTSAAATVTNGTKPTSVNGTAKKKPVAETVNVARPKTTGSYYQQTNVIHCPKTQHYHNKSWCYCFKDHQIHIHSPPLRSELSPYKLDEKATLFILMPLIESNGERCPLWPATGLSTSRPAPTTTRPSTATTKPSTTATAKTTASRVATAPSTGRTTAAQHPKTVAAKKDVSRPPSAAVAKKPPAAATSTATRKPEPSKPTAAVKVSSASKWSTTTKTADPKVPQSKIQQAAKSTPSKKPVAAVRFPAPNKLPLGRTPPASPVNKPANSTTSQAKRGTKPTQAVSPFTAAKKTVVANTTTPARAASAAGAAVAAVAAAAVLTERQVEDSVSLPQESSLAASASEEVPPTVLAQDTTPDVVPQETVQSHAAASSPPQSPVRTALPQTSPPQEQLESSAPSLTTQEQTSASAEPTLPPVASAPEEPVYLLTDQTPSTSKALPAANAVSQILPATNLNEEEDEEEREGSQLVSVSEMSGTTQPTEESRPGSAGPVGGSAWKAGGALFSELDSEEVSGSQQGASELSAPGVLEGTESMDDLGDGSLKGAIDMEGASAGSPDFEKVPDIPVNDFEDEDDDDRVCDMDVSSEWADEPQRPRHDNDVDDEDDEDVEMASEGVTESGLESYGNADEDDFAEDDRLDNLNRVAQPPPPPPLLPSASAAQWDQPNPFVDPWGSEPLQPQQVLDHNSQPLQVAGAAAASPLADPWQADSETPTQTPAQAWLELGSGPFALENQEVRNEPLNLEAQMYMDQSCSAPMQTLVPAPSSAPGMSLSSTLSSETSTPEELGDHSRDGKFQPQDAQAAEPSLQPDLDYQDLGIHMERGDGDEEEEEAEAETLPADEVLGGPVTAPTSNPSSSSVTEDEASDTEGEAQLDDSLESPLVSSITFDSQPPAQRCLSTVEEGEEVEIESGAGEETTPPSATSLASYGFDTTTTASNSNAQSTGESCIKSPGIFSLEELPEEAKEPCLIPQPHTQPCLTEQQYIECGKQEAESAEPVGDEVLGPEEVQDPSTPSTLQQPEENPDDIQPPYYSAICEKTENLFAGFTALPHPHRRDHAAYPRTYCDIVKPLCAAVTPPKLTCADLPPRNLGQQALSPQLRRLEQHQRQLLELQQRREQQSRPLEEAEQERKRREEEEQRKKKEEAEEEIKRNKEEVERKMREQADIIKKEEEERLRKGEELKQRRDLELQLQQQQQELKQRQQIMQWQQELQQSDKGQTVLLSPTSGLCTIYEALENSDEEEVEDEEEIKELNHSKEKELRQEASDLEVHDDCEKVTSDDEHRDSSPSTETLPPLPDSPQTSSNPPSQDGDSSSPCPPESPERPSPLDLDWGKKVDIVQQLINQTLLLNRDGCSSLLLLPGGAGGTLSPLESSLWPNLLPPLTPPSATVTSVSSFSPEATGSSPQGEWTVVELETHH